MTDQKHSLRWTAYTPPPPDLPAGVKREFISTSSGKLELLAAVPAEDTGKTPILFIPGSNCSAMCYIHWLPFFSSHGYPSYSISTRGRGQSWKPSLLSMTFTFKHTFALDILSAISHLRTTHPSATDPIVMGHSLGGGLAQYILSSSLSKFSALILLASPPGYGGKEIMTNWAKNDPSMGRRSLKGWFHPRATLGSTSLVHNAFFSAECPKGEVESFEATMPEFESAATGLSIMSAFGEAGKILAGVTGEGLKGGRKILCVGGGEDKLVSLEMVNGNVDWLREAIAATGGKAGDGEEAVQELVVGGSGHHLMRDIYWREAAAGVLDWLEGRKLDSVAK